MVFLFLSVFVESRLHVRLEAKLMHGVGGRATVRPGALEPLEQTGDFTGPSVLNVVLIRAIGGFWEGQWGNDGAPAPLKHRWLGLPRSRSTVVAPTAAHRMISGRGLQGKY